jgi:predicted Zn-dependent peptidase
MKIVKFCLFLLFYIVISTSVFAKSLSKAEQYNGLRYYFYQDKGSKIGAINVLIRAGSIFDEKGKFGTAFILADMLKKGGTKKYNTDELLDMLDKTGINIYTSCSKDFIKINVKFIKSEEKHAFDILEQILFYPIFNEKEFNNIKEETIGLITSYQNNNDYIALHQGAVNLFKNAEYAHSSFGEINMVRSLKIEDIKRFYKKYFISSNMIITFAGNLDKNNITSFIRNNFKTSPTVRLNDIYPVYSNKKNNLFKEKNLKQSYIYFLFPSSGLKGKDFYSLKVLGFILGGNLTSILAEKIRKELGLAYSVYSFNYPLVNGGFFVIGMQTENSFREKAVSTTINILKKLKKYGVPNEKIKFAKNYFTGKIPISLQSLLSIANYYSEGIFLNKTLPPWENDLKNIEKINKSTIDNLIKRLFDFNKMIISVVGKNGK